MTDAGNRTLSERLNDWWTFLATRMNHPKTHGSELKAERPALLDDLREAATVIEAIPSADKLEWIAKWFDITDQISIPLLIQEAEARGLDASPLRSLEGDQMQADLRRLAEAVRER